MPAMARSDASAGLPHDAHGAIDLDALDRALDLLAEGLPRRSSVVLARRPLAEVLRDLDALDPPSTRPAAATNGHASAEPPRAIAPFEVPADFDFGSTSSGLVDASPDVDVVFEPAPEVSVTPGAGVVFELAASTPDVDVVFEPAPFDAPEPADATGPVALIGPEAEAEPVAQTDPGAIDVAAPAAETPLSEPPALTLEPVPIESLGPLPPLSEPPLADDEPSSPEPLTALSFDGDQTAMAAPAWLAALDDLAPPPRASASPPSIDVDPSLFEPAPLSPPTDPERAAAEDAFARYSDPPLDAPPSAALSERPALESDDATSLALDLDLGALEAPTMFPTEPLPQQEFVAPPLPMPPSMPPLPARSTSGPPPLPSFGPPPLPGFRADRKPTLQMPSLRAPSLRVPPAVPTRRASVAAVPAVSDDELEAIELDLNEVEEVSPPPLPGAKK
ncbi:MAG: hypothetical protein R3A52_26175 [Polyangiales bacterium]